MPTRAELRAAGRGDLLRAINAAGGFLAVAQVCRGGVPLVACCTLALTAKKSAAAFSVQHLFC